MAFEDFAFKNLAKRHPNIIRNGLKNILRQIEEVNSTAFAEEVASGDPGFIPDATLWDKERDTVLLFEIEDTNMLTEEKLNRIILFSHMLYNCSGLYTELWVVDRYGLEEKRIWGVKDEITWPDPDSKNEMISVTEIEAREAVRAQFKKFSTEQSESRQAHNGDNHEA